MRRHVHLASIGQQKAIGFAVLVDEKLVHGPADFGEVIGIDPMHVEAPCVRLSGSPADVFARRVPTGMPLFLLCFEESRDERSVVFHDTRRRECGRMGNAGLTSTRRANAALWLGNDAVRYGARMKKRDRLRPIRLRAAPTDGSIRTLSFAQPVFFSLGVQELTVDSKSARGFRAIAL